MKRNASNEITRATVEEMRPRILLVGGVLGAAVGVAAAYLLLQRYDESQSPDITMGEGVKIGMLVAGLLRSIATL